MSRLEALMPGWARLWKEEKIGRLSTTGIIGLGDPVDKSHRRVAPAS
jgi:hypothetical protein